MTTNHTDKIEYDLGDWPWQSEHCSLLPYVPFSSMQKLPEESLVGVYMQAKKDGVLGDVFPMITDMNLVKFINYFAQKKVLFGLRKPDLKAIGIGWLFDTCGEPGARMSNFGFIFFREAWGSPIVREMARLSLGYWFDNDKVDMLYGTMLASNKRAWRLAEDMRFRIFGPIPKIFNGDGVFKDGAYIQLDRTKFINERDQWAEADLATK